MSKRIPQTPPQQARPAKVQADGSNTVSTPKTLMPLLYGKEHYKIAGIGLAIMALGFILMAGGAMPSPEVWDEKIIYSPLRITVAPILILTGLVFQIYAIFKKA
jgi:hypothetical protein